MPALNFQRRFAHRVAAGSKRHTIRAWRKRPFQVGDNLAFFTGMRTKKCRRLRRDAVCTAARAIVLDTARGLVVIEGNPLKPSEIESLARKDGFPNVESFWEFFAITHGRHVRGQLIEWRS